ncbi:MAG: hypothetical protein AB8I08_03425 [Sandaracinaceae bacterium]
MSSKPREDERTRNDRAGGRQVVWVLLFLLVPLLALGIWAVHIGVIVGSSLAIGAALLLAWRWPHLLLRIAMGRWSELLPEPEPGTNDDARRVVQSMQEGVSLEVAVAEASGASPQLLARVGVALMVFGTSAAVLCCVYTDTVVARGLDPIEAPLACFGVAFVGMVLWYRTL